MPNYEKDRYWATYEQFIDADFRPLKKGSQSKATKHFKDVALVIYRRANHVTGKCWPSIHRIELETSLSECTVRRNIAVLVETGMVKKQQGGGARSNTYYINLDHAVWHGSELEVAKLKEKLLKGETRTEVMGPERLVPCPQCGGPMDKRSRCCKACVRDTGSVHTAIPVACTPVNPSVHDTHPLACTMEERLLTSVTSDETPEPPAQVIQAVNVGEEVRPSAAHIQERCGTRAAETATQSPVSVPATRGYVSHPITSKASYDVERIRQAMQALPDDFDLDDLDLD